jgi:hypothetical protein
MMQRSYKAGDKKGARYPPSARESSRQNAEAAGKKNRRRTGGLIRLI